jgi:CDP-6-deoxy-D-xylo-4-hexulose-3-dehydrase
MIDFEKRVEDLINILGEDFNILKYVYNKDFIAGITPIYYSGPYWDNKEVIEAVKVLLNGEWLSSGEKVKLFENKFVKKIHSKYGVMVNSGSSANLVMLATMKKYFDWVDKSEIITSVVCFPTTVAPIVQNNLKPVFIDIEMNSLNFDITKIEEKINVNTKAILLSPVLGNPPDIDVLIELCTKYNIHLLLDNCDSLGSQWKDKYLNEYSVMSTNSFYPSHHITTGEGGMVVSDNKELIKLARSIAWWGRDCFCVGSNNLLPYGSCGNRFDTWLEGYDGIIDHKYVFNNIGYNLKPLDMQGAIGLVQIEKMDDIHKKRKTSKQLITNLFIQNIKDIDVPDEDIRSNVSWFGVPIICKSRNLKDKLVEYLEKNKIQTRNYFAGNILLHKGYKHLGLFYDYPEANKVLEQVFFVGASPHYNVEVFNYIEKTLKVFDNESVNIG